MKKLLALLCFFSPVFLSAELAVELGGQKIGIADSLDVVVTVKNSDDTPELTSADFTLVGQDQSSQISIINGSVSKSTRYHYALKPIHEGKGSLSIKAGAETKGPFEVEIVAGSTAPKQPPQAQAAPGDPFERFFGRQPGFNEGDVLIRNEPATGRAHPGEVIPLDTVIYYRQRDFNVAGFVSEDDIRGASVEPSPSSAPGERVVTLGGQRYGCQVMRRRLLWPLLPGTLHIKGGVIQVVKPGFFGSGPRANVKIPDVDLVVEDFPPQRPASFQGGVGEFSLEVTCRKTKVRMYEPCPVTITVSGTGNFRTLVMPQPAIDTRQFTLNKPDVKQQVTAGTDGFTGKATLDLFLIPKTEGSWQVPPIEFTWWSPRQKKFVTQLKGGYTITVARPEPGDSAATVLHEQASDRDEGTSGPKDLHFIHTVFPTPGGRYRVSLILILGHLLAAAVGALAVQQYRHHERRRKDYAGFRQTQAWSRARRTMKGVEKLKDPGARVRLAEEAIHHYLADRLDLSTGAAVGELERAALERPDRAELLAAATLVRECQRRLYAPGSSVQQAGTVEDLPARILKAIEGCERASQGPQPETGAPSPDSEPGAREGDFSGGTGGSV